MLINRTDVSAEYSVVIIDNLSGFSSIQQEWDALASQYPDEYFFLSHGWYDLWLKYFLNDSSLCIVTVYKGARLVAIAPFLGKEERIKRIPVRKLESIGNAYSPLRSLIIDSSESKQRLGAFLFEALSKISGWDIAQIGPIYDGELYSQAEELLCNCGGNWLHKVVDCNWRLPCAGLEYDGYLKNRDKGVRQEIKRRNKKLGELGSIEIKIVKGHEAAAYLKDYWNVYENSWKQTERLGPGFHVELGEIAARGNNLLLAIMYLDGQPIAAQYRILSADKCFFLKTAYDSRYKRYSVGVILLNRVLQYLMDSERVKLVDFGPGNEIYKADWAEIKGNYTNFYLFNKTIKSSLIHFAYTKVNSVMRRLEKRIAKDWHEG